MESRCDEMVCKKGIDSHFPHTNDEGERLEDNRKVEVELYYNFDDSEVLIRKCKLLACEKDSPPLYPDDPGIRPVNQN
jgi:hypothetical protein